jgi:hypothetical protein
MADPTSVLPRQKPGETLGYRPLSGLAIASLALGSLFSLFLLVGAGLAFFTNTPLPDPGVAVLLVPAVGAVLGFVANWQIRHSDGTRVGAGLATWGRNLSIVSALCYVAYVSATELAVRQQATIYIDRWLKTVVEGRINEAFVQTLEPSRQRGIDPNREDHMARFRLAGEKGQKGPLPQFEESQLVRILEQGGPEARIENLGLREWKYQGGGYQVRQAYRITTLEGVFDMVVSVRGSEAQRGSKANREWHVLFEQTGVQLDEGHFARQAFTREGLRARQLVPLAQRFAENWVGKINGGNYFEAYLDTQEPEARGRLRDQVLPRPVLLNGSALAAASGGGWPMCLLTAVAAMGDLAWQRITDLPGYRDFAAGKIVETKQLEGPEPTRSESVRHLQNWFHLPEKDQSWYQAALRVESSRPWKMVEDRLQVPFQVKMNLIKVEPKARQDRKNEPEGYNWDGTVLLESERHWLEHTPSWRVVKLELRFARQGYRMEK